MIKDENYILIQGWMINKLELKGLELMIYAIIYGFSQNEGNKFTGSLAYLAEWTNSTKQGVIKALNNLIKKDYVEKTEIYKNGVKYCEYNIKNILIVLNKVEQGIKQSLTGVLNKVEQGIKQSLTNSKEYNTINNKENNKDNIITDEDLFLKFYEKYPIKKSKNKALTSFKRILKTVKFETIMQGLDNYLQEIKDKKIEEQYIKHPSTWLNQGCWEDEYNNTVDKNKLLEMAEMAMKGQ